MKPSECYIFARGIKLMKNVCVINDLAGVSIYHVLIVWLVRNH